MDETYKINNDHNKKVPIEVQAMDALGLGFDLASDFRLKFAKREGRLVVLDEDKKRDVMVPGGTIIRDVPEGIRCDKGDRIRFRSDVLEFNQMSELLNQQSLVQGKVPSGYLNSIFNLSGAWLNDAADAKYLALDGYFISLYYLHLTASPLVLHHKVKQSVPSYWNPQLLSRFIQTFGTHIIVGMSIGGQDLLCVKQKPSSTISPAELKSNLEDVGDCLFAEQMSPSLLEMKTRDDKEKIPDVFKRMLAPHTMQYNTNSTESSSKEGLTVVWSKRGGDVISQSHSNWLQTVAANPDAILFKFVPITSLLTGIPGSGYLSHAINLYLRYKPLLEDLQYFLEFQVPRQWAPLYCELPLRHQGKKTTCPPLQFRFMGPKLRINPVQVLISKKPITGMRLYLEGKKSNLLAIHVEHLSSIPSTMLSKWTDVSTNSNCKWRGSDDHDPINQFLEPLKWKNYASICSSVVKHDPSWLKNDQQGVYIVTGAQLITKGKWPKNVLHLRLLFTHLPKCTIRKTEWAAVPEINKKTLFMNFSTTFTFTQKTITDAPKQLPTALNSGVYPDGPPVPIRSGKLKKYVDTAEIVRGPHDTPGHWLVIGAKLITEGGKIGLLVKFALVDYDIQD